MLELKKISKDYKVGEGTFRALNEVDLKFNKGEFVAILGHSGCGKTTSLNIIGGLDRYTEGDLVIEQCKKIFIQYRRQHMLHQLV